MAPWDGTDQKDVFPKDYPRIQLCGSCMVTYGNFALGYKF